MSKIKDAILGLIVGDALGVPVEFKSRDYLDKNPVTCMMGNGTYKQPIGTWSDDTSLTLATMDGLAKGEDSYGIMCKFVDWLYDGKYTAHNDVFDVGATTGQAISKFSEHLGINPIDCGLTEVDSNGNGSLMRILPIALSNVNNSELDIINKAMEASKWTHGHITSQLCCAWYCLVAVNIYNGKKLDESFELANNAINRYYGEVEELVGVFDSRVVSRSYIRSTGYVVHGIEVAQWCLKTSTSYEEAVLKAINLGEDTDTNGAITGGLAGIYFGNIPSIWIENVCNKELIYKILDKFESKLT
jgi:ADP-ribosyl-[dinitrogen reductase] hydrolase